VSLDSDDEDTQHPHNGKLYKAKELLDLYDFEADQAKQEYNQIEKEAKKQKTGNPKPNKPNKSDKSDKSGASAATKGRNPEKGTPWTRFLVGNRTVLGPSVYKKYCSSVDRDWQIPVKFHGPDGQPVFKILDAGKYDGNLRWAKNPDQELDEENYF
jgi:hypothetical protein